MYKFGLLTIIFISLTAVHADEAPAGNLPRVVTLKTESINGAVHWMPETIKAYPGEKFSILALHQLEGGFDFHGLYIPELKVSATINRNAKETKPIAVTVPKSLKPGEYKIGCQFHPKHVPAKLVIEKEPKPAPAK